MLATDDARRGTRMILFPPKEENYTVRKYSSRSEYDIADYRMYNERAMKQDKIPS